MTRTAERTGSTQFQTTQVHLEIWHPNCWTLQTTAAVDAGLIAHGVYQYDGIVSARLTAHADRTEQIDDLVQEIADSELTTNVKEINEYFNPHLRTSAAGNATQELLVEYEPRHSIHDAFVSRGFVPEEEIRIHDGYEYWRVIVSAPRMEIQRRLDDVRREMDAEITIEGMKSPETTTAGSQQSQCLSERQREAFELAKREGYYQWPRETSAIDLAANLGVSKTTFLEHLRKAEAKILGEFG